MRLDLLRFLLDAAIVKYSRDQQPLICRQAAASAATLLKRAWGEIAPEQRRSIINEIDGLAKQGGTAEARRASIDVLTAIVLEFSPAASSSLGLPWDYHEACKQDLQDGYLFEFLQHALAVAQHGANAALANSDGGACIASLNLLSAVLNCNYTPAATSAGLTSAWAAEMHRHGEQALHVKPPPAWREVLLSDEAFSWLGPLAAGVRASNGLANSPLGQAIRQLLLQLSSMSGDIFIKEGARQQLGLLGGPGPATRGRHLARVLALLLPELTPAAKAASRASSHDEAVMDTCRALLAAATAHRLGGFLEGATGLDGGAAALFGALSDVTVAMMAAGEAAGAEEAGDILLEIWSELCVDPCRGAVAGSDQLIGPAAAVFIATMRRELARVAAAAWEDEEEYEGGEEAHSEAWLAGLAAVGRAACAMVLPALAHQLQECQGALQACMQRDEDPSAALEQLCWVCGMCAYVLADAGDGETPLVPIAIADACSAASAAGQEDPCVGLAQRLLSLGAICQQHAGKPVISPRLMQEVCAALGRWAETYLLADNPASPALAAAFSDPEKAREVAEGLIRLAMASLTSYPGDMTLHRVACMRLLAPLLRRRAVCALVMHCPAWQELCGATAARVQAVQILEAGVQRRLMLCLLRATVGLGDSSRMAEYVASLLNPLVHNLQRLNEQTPAALQQADQAVHVLNLVQSLRGAARGVDSSTHVFVYGYLEAVQSTLLRLLTVYQSQPGVYGQILKLAADTVEYHAGLLEASKARELFRWAVQLVATYASHRTTASSAASLQIEEERAALCALLRLLTQLTNTEASDESEVAAAVFEGLDRIMPSIKEEHLKFPKLRSSFFSLVAHMVEAHAPRVAELPPATFSALMTALCFGMSVQDDTETEAAVFEAAGALAKHHYLVQKHGAQGLGHLNTLNPATGQTALGSVLLALLRRVLVDDPGFEAVDYAAEAALPLWLAEPGAAEAALGSLAGMVGSDEGALATASIAFQGLGKAAHVANGLDRASRRQFNGAFRRFVMEVRGAIRKR